MDFLTLYRLDYYSVPFRENFDFTIRAIEKLSYERRV